MEISTLNSWLDLMRRNVRLKSSFNEFLRLLRSNTRRRRRRRERLEMKVGRGNMILSKKRSIYSFLTGGYADFLYWAKSAMQDMDNTGKLLELGGSLKSITYSILRAF